MGDVESRALLLKIVIELKTIHVNGNTGFFSLILHYGREINVLKSTCIPHHSALPYYLKILNYTIHIKTNHADISLSFRHP